MARSTLGDEQLAAYLDSARRLARLGRGAEPVLALLEDWPDVVTALGGDDDDVLPALIDCVDGLQQSANGRAIAPLLQTLAAVTRRLASAGQLRAYLAIVGDLAQRTSASIHGRQATLPSPGLPEFLRHAPQLAALLSLEGMRRWVDYGVRNYAAHAPHQIDYFALHSPDSRAILQRERRGTLLANIERALELALRALWNDDARLWPIASLTFETDAADAGDNPPVAYYDELGVHLPEILEEQHGVCAIDRYRARLAHIAGHRRWSEAQTADNLSPMQRLAIEFFEDSRIDTLLVRAYPGLRRILLALHPRPIDAADSADSPHTALLRQRLAMLSRALLDPAHDYADPVLLDFVERFHALLRCGESSTSALAQLALAYVARTRRASDQAANVLFADTQVDYRDDNRQLWRFIELGDEEESFRPRHQAAAPAPTRLVRHYPEWDYRSASYRPDWTSVYEALHPSGNGAQIDALLDRYSALARRLQRLFEQLRPQDRVRVRYQEDGSDLDLDVATASLIDYRSGHTPDPRINLSHRTDQRDVAVLLLVDVSQSLNDTLAGGTQTMLELTRAAVSLLAWAIDALGDPLAIAAFHSNTRHEVRYLHVKGYSEGWGDAVKARLAALNAGYSTRLGAAVRHAAHTLEKQVAARKLMLIVTDGQPADIDSPDPRLLIEDARQAVQELSGQGIYTHCINLDARADDYVSHIFGPRHTVIDKVERLPERLAEVFLSLTR